MLSAQWTTSTDARAGEPGGQALRLGLGGGRPPQSQVSITQPITEPDVQYMTELGWKVRGGERDLQNQTLIGHILVYAYVVFYNFWELQEESQRSTSRSWSTGWRPLVWIKQVTLLRMLFFIWMFMPRLENERATSLHRYSIIHVCIAMHQLLDKFQHL